MELKMTKEMDKKEFECFFEEEEVPLESMKEHGYFLYTDNKPIAFFALVPIEQTSYWLRTLLIKRGAPVLTPVTIIQTAESLSQNNGAESLVIHSKTTMLDELLTQLGYRPTDKEFGEHSEANWWITSLRNVDKNVSYTQ
ncbi:hypothetical protein SH601_17360 [Gracilibacillus sp. S3-1-1]|uniref:Uncharacterized protein n=1 Tax=Gracilibacillus pellucidus TaxID=3095368 RepID=A0ACC6M9V4_9BACI|nr:hypothetical protein [Gracilibacillus sp. S3-1-1]MDX8047729.1 hypothetical protein [Gracilibacillus sp. S3-1-1]